MAYYFMVEDKKGKYKPLDITKSGCFTRFSNLKGMGLTLKEIDAFTTQFYNELELRSHLLNENILEDSDALKTLSARILKNGKYNKVIYDFLYQKDIEYIINPKKVIKKIYNKLENGDFRFVKEYAEHFISYRDCSSTAPEVRALANASIRIGSKHHAFDELDENYDPIIVRMTKLLIYDYFQGYSGKITYKDTIKYRNLHAIIAFINNYDKKYNEERIETKEETKIKKKTKKNDPIEGQTSLF